jgi:hypothetical protein
MYSGKKIWHPVQRGKDVMHQAAEDARCDLAGRLVDGSDAAHMQGRLAFVLFSGKDFEFGVVHQDLAGIAVQLHLSVEGHLLAWAQNIFEICAMKPAAQQAVAGAIGEDRLEDAQRTASEAGQMGGFHGRDDGRHFSRREAGDGLQVRAVLVAERSIQKQIFHGADALGGEGFGARGSNAFDVAHFGREVHRND